MVADGHKMSRHLRALIWKNKVLKFRHPCSLCCELLFAVGATSFLVAVRSLSKDSLNMDILAESHVDATMPVLLPECAEYVDECHVGIVEVDEGTFCFPGLNFGCAVERDTGEIGMFVSFGCAGEFEIEYEEGGKSEPTKKKIECGRDEDLGDNGYSMDRVLCFPSDGEVSSATKGGHGIHFNRRLENDPGKPEVHEVVHRTPMRKPGPFGGRGVQHRERDADEDAFDDDVSGGEFGAFGPAFAMMASQGDKVGKRRYEAKLAIAPAKWGARLKEWLETTHHPWASNVELFDNAESVQKHVEANGYPARDRATNISQLLCGAIVFENDPASNTAKYTLRFNMTAGSQVQGPAMMGQMRPKIQTNSLYDAATGGFWNSFGKFSPHGLQWYTQSGFLALQRTVDTFLEGTEEHTTSPALRQAIGEDGRVHVVVPFPTPARHNDFLFSVPHLLDMFLLIAFSLSIWILITSVVQEREARLREGMRMMGLHPAALYSSWVISQFIVNAFSVFGVVLCLSGGGVLRHSSASLLFVWIMLFSAASISFGLLISSLFQKARQAAVVGSMFFFFSSFFHSLVAGTESDLMAAVYCLVPTVPFVMGAKVYQSAEMQDIGIEWTNASFQVQLGVRAFSVWESCKYLAFDAVFLLFLFLYLDQVIPRDIGVQRPWYFIFSKSFWMEALGYEVEESSTGDSRREAERTGSGAERESMSALIEREIGEAASMMARTGQIVELQHLSKSFADVQAVQDLDLMMYSGEIFALLGHNGAGKTTTLAMLCGLIKPSSGSCKIFGHDLVQDRVEAQKLLGVCPQHDVLWDVLDASEHLYLFGLFKGVPEHELAEEVKVMLQRVRLIGNDGLRMACKLSGGMKRKLSLGIAFIGGSRLVLLDEPTSGLDPFSRRMVWELLRSMKPGRATVLSTHYMDEADILGDRIAILHQGCLRCCGSSNFLKRAYGCGYNLTLVLKDDGHARTVHDGVVGLLPSTIKKSEIRTLSHSGKELIIQLPFSAAKSFPEVLGAIESNMQALHLESYGISVTTLEEVFLKVASGEAIEVRKDETGEEASSSSQNYYQFKSPTATPRGTSEGDPEFGTQVPVTSGERLRDDQMISPSRFVGHVFALLRKRIRYGMRDWKGFVCQLAVPLLLLSFCLSVFSYAQRAMPPLQLDVGTYNEQCGHNTIPFSYVQETVEADKAKELLEHGHHEYRGHLQQFAPDPDIHLTHMEQQVLKMSTRSLFEELKAAGKTPDSAELPWSESPELKSAILRAVRKLEYRVGALAAKQGSKDLNSWVQNLQKQYSDALDQAADNSRTLKEDEEEISQSDRRFHKLRRLEEKQTDVEMLVVNAGFRSFMQLWSQAVSTRQAWQEIWSVPATVMPALGELLKKHAPSWQLPGWLLAEKNDRRLEAREIDAPGDADETNETEEKQDAWQQHPFRKNMQMYPSDDKKACLRMQERMVFDQLDTNNDGIISKQELVHSLGSMPLLSMSELQGEAPIPISEHDVADILADVVVALLDKNEEQITPEAVCNVSEVMHGFLDHIINLGEYFSDQLLRVPSENKCFRYGGYYVVAGGKGKDDPPTVPGSHAVIFANSTSAHSSAAYQAAFTNARLHRQQPGKRVEVSTHPFPHTANEKKDVEKNSIFRLALWVCLSLSLIPPSLVQYVVKERTVGAQQLQVLSGASPVSYWLAIFLYDMAVYSVQALLIPQILHFFGFYIMLSGECGRCFNCILIAFGPAIAGFSYVFSFLFKDHAKAAYSILALSVLATIFAIALSVLWLWNFDPTNKYPTACERSTAEHPHGNCASFSIRYLEMVVSPLFKMVPTVCAHQAIIAIAFVAKLNETLPKEAVEQVKKLVGGAISFDVFSDDWAGLALKYLIGEACSFLFVAILADWWMHQPGASKMVDPAACRKGRQEAAAAASPEARSLPLIGGGGAGGQAGDDSVQQERDYVAFEVAPKDVALRVSNLEKAYAPFCGPVKQAVKGVSFSVRYKEVFGLLGHNGAGKTSALKCIVGEQCCTSGSLQVGGFDMERATAKARRRIGYCPQFDALLELLTVRDHLELFAALRSLPSSALEQAKVDFKLFSIWNRRADHLSGGNKRKLSAAIALLGGPSLAVLDEPSCGLDPQARRSLWDTVQAAVAGNKDSSGNRASSVLLTTHSMEEAEALSTRLGIMAAGEMLTIGTAQQIKQRHGFSHELSITLRPIPPEHVKDLLERLSIAAPDTKLNYNSIAGLLTSNSQRHQAYQRSRCVVRTQIEVFGFVEASVFAEWWCQQDRGDALAGFLVHLSQEGCEQPSLEIIEQIGALWRFRLPSASIKLPELFKRVEQESETLWIQEYTITQASLEQVFNDIAQEAEPRCANTNPNIRDWVFRGRTATQEAFR